MDRRFICNLTRLIFLRGQIADEVGLRSGFGVPILSGESVLAVLLFFKRHFTPKDGRLLDLITAVAAQLGSLIQRKQAEAAHRKSEERLQLALEATNLGLWDWNLKKHKMFRDIRYKQMLGYEENDISEEESSFNLLIHPDDRTVVAKILKAYLIGELPILKPNFGCVVSLVSGNGFNPEGNF
ncbi:MAG: hypothetical protein HC908_13965 [Calothrix sp. SM1_7_51]|nr:hypothetical protein [Calothrix sp. SM1_7_51]